MQDVFRLHGISEATFYRWKAKCGAVAALIRFEFKGIAPEPLSDAEPRRRFSCFLRH